MMTDLFMRTGAVFKREFFSLTGSAAAWVFLVIFLALSGFLTFMVSDILGTGQADLSPFFDWMPWLFLFVVPALAMPLWSEERRTGTLELSLSYPVSIGELVAGKFLAGLAILAFALLLTLGTPLTIAAFGEPDVSAVICGYLGALMAGAVFLAVSCFCSAMTRSQTASFLLSLLLCALLLFAGWDKVTDYMVMYLPETLCRWISYFALIPHYQAFQRGLIDTSEIAYSLLTTLLFLYLTGAALGFSASGIGGLFLPGAISDRYTWRQIGRLAGGVATAFYVYLCLIYTAGVFPVRFDATADRAYSLTEQSRSIAAGLKEPVEIRLYFSASNAMPRPLQLYGERVEWLLRDFVRSAKGRINFSIIRPEQDSADEEAAQLDGLVPVHQTGTGDRFYLGMTVSKGANMIALPSLTPDREVLLEYELVRAVQSVSRKNKPVLGVISALPVLGVEAAKPGVRGEKPLDIALELAKDYTLHEISMDTPVIPDKIDGEPLSGLLIYHPAGISKRALYAIDQYLMRGGKAAVFLDPRMSKMLGGTAGKDMEALRAQLEKRQSDLDPLISAWGIAYDRDMMAADMNFKFNPAPAAGVMAVQPSVLLVTPEGISRNSPLTVALTRLFMIYPGAFPVVKPVSGLHYEPLVTTTGFSRLFPIAAKPHEVLTALGSDPNAADRLPLPLVLSVKGTFPSAFPDGPPDAAAGDGKHLKKSAGTPEVILFADSDMLFRSATTEIRTDPASGQRTSVIWNDNITLLQNVLEHLCSDSDLSTLRTRKPMSRPLTKIAESRSKVELEFNERYSALLRDFRQLQNRVQAIRRKQVAGGNRIRLTDEEKRIFSIFARREAEFRREEKAIRNSLKEGLDAINSRARLVNILLIPGGVILLGIGWGILRRTGRKGRKA